MKVPYLVVCSVIAMGLAAAQNADFGDLADPGFPTLRFSTSSAVVGRTGPYHYSVNHEWIGTTPLTTTLEPEAKLVDLDEDDGLPTFSMQNMYRDGLFQQTGVVRVAVTTDSDLSVRYLNIAADLNSDGRFATFPDPIWGLPQYEWVACNVPVVHVGETKEVVQRFVLLNPMTAMPCVRVTLTTMPIAPALFGAAGWDGSGPVGGFDRGETEDYCPSDSQLSDYHYDHSGGAWIPPVLAPPPGDPGAPPPPPKGPTSGPPGQPGGPAWQPPTLPGLEPPEFPPPTTEPPRLEEAAGTPVPPGSVSRVRGMPDIKQGENECVPSATANSLRYLMDKAGATPSGDDDAINRGLRDRLKGAMGTTAEGGTTFDPTGRTQFGFEKGKQEVVNTTDGLKDRVVTSVISNPSVDQICAAIAAGKNVEIMIYEYKPDGHGGYARNDMGHMVTVVGCVRHPDGRVELLFHDPADIMTDDEGKPIEGAGDTVDPPRVNSMFVRNKTGDAVNGGLEIIGLPEGVESLGRKFFIEVAWTEDLAEEADESAGAIHGSPVTPELGAPVTLTAPTPGGKNGTLYLYQWMLNGDNIPGANQPLHYIPSFGPDDEGSYVCWVYDDMGTYWFSTPLLLTLSGPPTPTPVGGLAGLALALAAAITGARRVAQGRRR